MTVSGPPGPPAFPPSSSPPPVPEGWKAMWSGEHNAWYFCNQATHASTWENPLNRGPPPPSPPPYAGGSYAPQSTESLYDDDEKSSTSRGLPPLLGRVFGSHSHHHSQSPAPPINQLTRPNGSPTSGSFPLYIHAACFCDQDITQKVRGMVTPQQTLSIRCDSLTYHFGDPWPNHHKQFSVLYSYGQQPWQLVATMEGNDTVHLNPLHPVDHAQTQFVQPPTSRVVALVWGTRNALADADNTHGRSAGMKIMEIEREGRLEASNSWIGFDGCPGIEKMAVVYYRHPNGSVGVLTAREGETLRLPWNAFTGAI
ncbi:hypothetical protein EG329_003695 [Mollisiaceae sp. DMI_Dod_QoI]|nr:hypothetical protein EG329_003695 [Helotiales sp. DMI_Dod_QoI]